MSNLYKTEILNSFFFQSMSFKRSSLKKAIRLKLEKKNIDFNVIDFNAAIVNLIDSKQVKEIKDPTFKNEEIYEYNRKKQDKIKITCKRWFQKSYGNTYHSVSIDIPGHVNIYIPFTYGYENQCLETARKELEKQGILEESNDPTWKLFESNNIDYVIEDVNRKKDL